MLCRYLVCSILCLASISVFAQSPQTDLALSHNKLLQQKTGEGVYKLIGTYKVIGTPFLFGERNKGNMFSTEAKAYNIFLSYNTYNQELEFYSTSNPDKPLVKSPGEVDSFVFLPNIELGLNEPVKFVHGKHIGSKENVYYQEVFAGNKYSIYKKYKSELGYVSTNYVQSELRQFDLGLEYFYNSPEKQMKKIKPNSMIVAKEFKKDKDLSTVVSDDMFTANPDAAFRRAFESLNQ